MTVTNVEPGNRVQLPAEWAEALGIRGRVVLDKTDQGILIRPCPPATWEDIFATKLTVGTSGDEAADFEVTRDDLLF